MRKWARRIQGRILGGGVVGLGPRVTKGAPKKKEEEEEEEKKKRKERERKRDEKGGKKCKKREKGKST